MDSRNEIDSRVDSTTCKRLRLRMLNHDFMAILVAMRPRFILQLCIFDFRIVYVWMGVNDVRGSSFTCGLKTLYAFTNLNEYVWTGPYICLFPFASPNARINEHSFYMPILTFIMICKVEIH